MEKVFVRITQKDSSCFERLAKAKKGREVWERFKNTIAVDLVLKDEQKSERELGA